MQSPSASPARGDRPSAAHSTNGRSGASSGPAGPERGEAGPGARLVLRVDVRWSGYQVPADGQAPEPPVLHARSIVPSDFFSIEKELPDFELAVIL